LYDSQLLRAHEDMLDYTLANKQIGSSGNAKPYLLKIFTTKKGLDKEKCYRQLQENARAFPELNQFACGKCATGPCALKSR